MESKTYSVLGTMTGPHTVELAHDLPLGKVAVEVVLKAVGASSRVPIRDFLAQVWAEQQNSGVKPRTSEEVERELDQDRQSW